MGALFQIVYTSAATRELNLAELLGLLKGSVERNSRLGITGLLLYKNCCFLQALEGEEETVVRLFAKISHDPRHHHVIPLIHEPIQQRSFPDSAMAFPDLDSPELRNLPGYSEFLNTPLNGELLAMDIPKCQRLLLLFKQNNQPDNDGPLKV
jgi:hypothetical protein